MTEPQKDELQIDDSLPEETGATQAAIETNAKEGRVKEFVAIMKIADSLLSDNEIFSSYLFSRVHNLEQEEAAGDILEKEVKKVTKAYKSAYSLREGEKERISVEIGQALKTLDEQGAKEFTQQALVAGSLFATNMAISNIADIGLTALMGAILISGNASPTVLKVLGGIVGYQAATQFLPIPSIAGFTRYLWYVVPENIIVMAANIAFLRKGTSKKELVFASLNEVKKAFTPAQLIMIFEYTSPILFINEFLRIYGANLSLKTIRFILDLQTLEKHRME